MLKKFFLCVFLTVALSGCRWLCPKPLASDTLKLGEYDVKANLFRYNDEGVAVGYSMISWSSLQTPEWLEAVRETSNVWEYSDKEVLVSYKNDFFKHYYMVNDNGNLKIIVSGPVTIDLLRKKGRIEECFKYYVDVDKK